MRRLLRKLGAVLLIDEALVIVAAPFWWFSAATRTDIPQHTVNFVGMPSRRSWR